MLLSRTKLKKLCVILNADLPSEEEDVVSGSGRQWDTDCLRFMICLCDDEMWDLYLKSQTPKDKDGVDSCYSEEKAEGWIDLMLVVFNESDDPTTYIVPNLHNKLGERIIFPKGSYELM